MARKKKSPRQSILEYNAEYGHIPKDYMERLSWLYREENFTKDDLEKLMVFVDELGEVQWSEVTYIFYMHPHATPRPKLNPNTFTFYVGGAYYNKQIFEKFMEVHSDNEVVISTPCIMETKTYTQTPSGMSKIEKMAAELELLHNVNRPDWDNLGKSYCDMVQDALVSEDSIVIRGAVEKFYSVLPRVEVNVRFMTRYDCRYNKSSVEKRKSFTENPKTLKNIPYVIGSKKKRSEKV